MKENKDYNLTNLLEKHGINNLIDLCVLNKKYITQENLNYIIKNENNLLYNNISKLIAVYPNLINKININPLTVSDWVFIIQNQPELINKCNKIDEFDNAYWGKILAKQIQLIDIYKDTDKKIDQFLIYNCIKDSKTIEILNYVDIKKINIDSLYLTNMIINQPKIIEKINKNQINKIKINDWLRIITSNPDLINKCPISNKINNTLYYEYPSYIIGLISKHVQFKYLLPEKLNFNYLHSLLVIKHPKLIKEFNIDLNKILLNDFVEILKYHPYLIDKRNSLDEISYSFNDYYKSSSWAVIIAAQPNLLKYCNSDRLDSNSVEHILINQPKLIEKLTLDHLYESECKSILYNSKNYHREAVKQYIKNFHNSEVLTNMIGIYPDLKDLYTEKDLWKYVDFKELDNFNEYSILK